MKALIVGGNGQLGKSLAGTAPATATVVSHSRNTLDITDADAIAAVVRKVQPDVIFNAAAYTAVDRAESEERTALTINATAVGYLAEAARGVGAQLVHISTDFVFNGLSGIPYAPDAPTSPLSAYGRTKLKGENAAGEDALIVRTAWVYAPAGGNFVRTMLRLMTERREVCVVSDQIGTPTYAPDLAVALWTMSAIGIRGIYHYTDAGACSWYDFAVAIQEEALAVGLLDMAVPVIPISAVEYPTPAQRPHYSVLDKTSTFAVLGGPTPHWRENLRKMMAEIKNYG